LDGFKRRGHRPTELDIIVSEGAVLLRLEPLGLFLLKPFTAQPVFNGILTPTGKRRLCTAHAKTRLVHRSKTMPLFDPLTLDRGVMHLKNELVPQYAELVYYGFWFSPERDMLQAAIDRS
jgi:hypothetical protein